MPKPNSVRVLAAALATAALLTACGGSDGDDEPSTPADPGTEQPAPTKPEPELRCAP
ncbi:Uncharacterised protein [Bordetella ansorpii]|uniref:Lipoprotein n=1 Tax=Bordetella ansorpii TaxID=288768 RepID=A0A157S671_9BORD|nr:hypothetical protein [Bordetella ansorpii]SAI65920.1 Uncharacterised protein [Bordetella ansorpii]